MIHITNRGLLESVNYHITLYPPSTWRSRIRLISAHSTELKSLWTLFPSYSTAYLFVKAIFFTYLTAWILGKGPELVETQITFTVFEISFWVCILAFLVL